MSLPRAAGHRRGRPHKCNDRCVCPIHRTALIYAPAHDEHACQDVDCIHGHGIVFEALKDTLARRHENPALNGSYAKLE